ncbi:mechanosensitive ion channel protein 10-like, partial [Trifolium pratense]
MKDNKTTKNEVVLRISNNEQNRDFGPTQVVETSSNSPQFISKMGSSSSPKGSHAELIELENLRTTSTFFGRSEFSKPKSRMVEPTFQKDAKFVEEKTPREVHDGSGSGNVVTPKNPLIGTPREVEEEDDDDDEEVYKIAEIESTRFFDRVQESIFHQYILRTLSGPPLMEMVETVGKSSSNGRLSFKTNKKKGKKEQEQVIDVDKLKKMKQGKVSAWTMKGLINVIRSSGLSTISYTPESIYEEVSDNNDNEIRSEWEAKAAAYRIFRNVAKPGSKYIDKEDLLRFMKIEEVENLLPLFEGAEETRRIKRKSLKNWLVKVYLERRSLVHSLNDTKTAVDELNNLASAIVLVVAIIVWFLVMGFLTTQVLVFISSQLLLVVFVFGNTAKTTFEAIIFVFVMHPFDVGDRCVIDGVQMIVEEMNILTTIFLRYDNEKIFYPNSVLATKPISNFYRSPEMSDSVEFAVDVSTSIESIGALKARLKVYLESRPQHWRPNHNVVVKDIENVNKMKIGLYVTHTINFQNYTDKNIRRSELVLELKKILEDLDIKYHLLPQEVLLNH